MIKIEDEAFLLAKIKYSESSIIVTLLTKEHGILKGIIKGAFAKKNHNTYEVGNKFLIRASSRVDNSLLRFDTDIINNYFFDLVSSKSKLLIASVSAELICKLFPENMTLNLTYSNYINLIEALLDKQIDKLDLYKQYLIFEIMLLKEMGYELDLSECALCHNTDELIFISPKTGRAVCKTHGIPYQEKIFRLPKFLLDFTNKPDIDSLRDCAKMSEYFLNKYFFKQFGKEITYMRQILMNDLE